MGGRRSRYRCGLGLVRETKTVVTPDDYQAGGALRIFLGDATSSRVLLQTKVNKRKGPVATRTTIRLDARTASRKREELRAFARPISPTGRFFAAYGPK